MFAGFFGFFLVLCIIACIVLVIVAEWKIFTKAGKEGWKSLIPVYNAYTMLQILNMEPMLCFLSLLPGANFMLGIVMSVKLAKSFGKGTGFAIGIILLEPIFEMILAFGDAKYKQLPSSK
ncbi:signal peptidase I [Candidatus Saccharibacteria bacterium]|nr:signal peptidase I [Candidatus Saccharibacteria bacterium]MBR6122918.1 signal peptidase I [Candidatus Saccharibacteria bacterium]